MLINIVFHCIDSENMVSGDHRSITVCHQEKCFTQVRSWLHCGSFQYTQTSSVAVTYYYRLEEPIMKILYGPTRGDSCVDIVLWNNQYIISSLAFVDQYQ